MNKVIADIDIDFANRNQILSILPHVNAARLERGELKKHNTGIYLQNIPKNPINNIASIDFETAESRGYFKIDFLNVSIYNEIKSEQHLNELMNKEPLWELLLQKEFVDLLFHLKGHTDVLKKTCPTSVEQLAAVLAMIRPAKRYLIGSDWTTIMKEIWTKPVNGEYYFKKSHSFSYAFLVIVHMNLLCEQFKS
jgi:DNA polymerase III alpha subunit